MFSRVKSLFGGASTKALSTVGGGGNAYEAGRWDTREMAGWVPSINSADDETNITRDQVVARARDLSRNHPVISGAIDRRVETVVGIIRLEAQPAYEALGWTPERADDWATSTEAQWELWANDYRRLCDKHMVQSFPEQIETAYRHWWTDGEALAVVNMRKRGGPFETCVEIVDPDRLSNPQGYSDGMKLPNGNAVVGGIELNADGAPVAYHVRKRHPGEFRQDMDNYVWVRIPRYGPTGRPQVVHAAKRNRASQRRGVSRFVAAIKRIKMFDRYDDAEVEAALLNAVMAATVESPYPTGDVASAIAPGADNADDGNWSFAKQFAYRLGNAVKVMKGVNPIHLLPGESLKFNRAERPSQNYPDFQATGLRAMAANFGLSYAQVSQNWADINYSSARAMLNEIWRGLLHDRHLFTQAFCTPIYAAWLEEAVAIGRVKIPGRKMGFYDLRAELCMCEWKGPGRGTVDPLKEAQANEFELNAGTTAPSDICDSDGKDYRKVLNRHARDARAREKAGLEKWFPLKSGAGRPAEGEGVSGDGDAGDGRNPDGKFSPDDEKPVKEEAMA